MRPAVKYLLRYMPTASFYRSRSLYHPTKLLLCDVLNLPYGISIILGLLICESNFICYTKDQQTWPWSSLTCLSANFVFLRVVS